MKKLLLILAIIFIAVPSFATVYYGGAAGKNINADDLWYTAVTGSCAGDGSPVAWSTVGAGTHTLVANGCTIAIPNGANLTVTAAKISNKETDTPDADCVDGGTYTYTTSADYTLTINAAIEAGATTDCIAISGSADGAARVTINTGPITGGAATGIDGVIDSHTTGEVVVGSTGNLVTITGGSNATGAGYNYTASGAGTVKMYANATGATAYAVKNYSTNAGAVLTLYEGKCQGSDTSVVAPGCATSSAGLIYLNGVNSITGTSCQGTTGKVYFVPGATNYILMPVDTSYAAGTIDTHAVVYGPVDDGNGYDNSGAITDESEIKTGVYVGTALGTLSSGGGGGVWLF
jgi:hypothetical protein